jgi:hypothetical protein
LHDPRHGYLVVPFARYQALVSPYVTACSKNGENSGNFLAPRSALTHFLRNAMLSLSTIKSWMINLAKKAGADIAPANYLSPRSTASARRGRTSCSDGG